MTDTPLRGRLLLLTRPPEQAAALADSLRSLGARVETRPAVSVVPPLDPGPARNAVRALERYAWVIFTSVNGVRFFRAACSELQSTTPDPKPACAAIGPATARALEAGGDRPDVVAQESHSEGLARALSGKIASGERVLVVRPEVARSVLIDALRAMGAHPEPVAFYRNVPAPGVEGLADDLCGGRYDVVVLTSPSSLERLLEARPSRGPELLAALARTRLVAIGPVTARALARAGLSATAVAEQPADEGVLRSIVGLFP